MAKNRPRRKPRAGQYVSNNKVLAGLALAADLMDQEKMAEARRVLEELHKRHPGRADVLNNLAYTCHQLDDLATYLTYCVKLCRLTPNQAANALVLASAYALNERPVLALRVYHHFLERWPAHEQADEVRHKIGQLEPGVREMIAAAGLVGTEGLEAAAMHEEVQILLAQGSYQEGCVLAQQLIERHPHFAPVYNNLSQMLFLSGQQEEAMATARQVLAFSPDNLQATANLARFLFLTGRQDEAAALAKKLQTMPSDSPDLWVKKAETFSFLGNDKAVLEAFSSAVKAGALNKSSAPPLLYHLAAAAALRLGQEDEAKKYWQQTLEMAPNFELAVENLRDLRQPVGQRHGPWAYSLQYWLPRQTVEALVAQTKAAGKSSAALMRVVQQFMANHPDVEHLLPLLLQRSDPPAAEFVVLVASIAKTPVLLQALRGFALGQRGSDQLRMRAAQVVVEAGVLPAGEISMWMEGEWRDVLLINMEISDAPVAAAMSAQAKRLLAQALHALHAGQGIEAERLLKQALELAPGDPSLLNNLAGAYQLQGRDAEHRQLVQQLHEQHPEYLFGRVQMAGLYTERGETEKAQEMLRPLLQRKKLHTSEIAALCKAQIALLLKEGRQDAAGAWFGLLERVYPEHPSVEVLRRQVQKPTWRRRLDKPFGQR